MYGAAGKLARGGGGGGAGRGGGSGNARRNSHSPFRTPPISRPSAPGRLSLGGGGGSAGPRGRGASGGAASTSAGAAEETFSLVAGNPLNFAMIIRLAPDLVEEIKRVEAEGGSARIKFDANANNSHGNVINVGDKNFKFTWSREMGDLCDIYEERRSGEDGNGLLVESGCAWRKLNVQRVLDESTKNHVKMLSEEAERKLKSRKAIVLDHQNPSMKTQIKALAAAESNPWRMPFKQKKEPPFKKRKAEPPPVTVGGTSKSVHKSSLPATTPLKGRPSPVSSPLDQSGASTSPFGSGNLMKGHTGVQDATHTQATNKSGSSEKEVSTKVMNSMAKAKPKSKGSMVSKPADLEHHSKGMTLKALEKAIGDAIPNSDKQIEPILKQVANYQAPGRYLLKQGVDTETVKKSSPNSGSSPELNHHLSLARDEDPGFSKRADVESEEQDQLNHISEDALEIERIDILNNSPDPLSDKKVSDNSEGPAASSSESGSGSDSDTDSSDSDSDSGSPSRSRSKSGSPVRSRSASSSDSESDASSNSKQASDEDVDIMTSDDDNESQPTLHDAELVPSKSPIPWRPDIENVEIGIGDHVSDMVEIEKDLPDDEHEAEIAVGNDSIPSGDGEKSLNETNYSSFNHHGPQNEQLYERNYYGEPESLAGDGFNQEQSDSTKKSSKGKVRGRPDDEYFDERPDQNKRLKGRNLNLTPMSGTISAIFGESPQDSSPDRPMQDSYKDQIVQTTERTAQDGPSDPSPLKGFNQGIPSRSMSESVAPGGRTSMPSRPAKAPSGEEMPEPKYSISSLHYSEGPRVQNDRIYRETHDEDGFNSDRRPSKFSAEGAGEKYIPQSESQQRKQEMMGKRKDAGSRHSSYRGLSPKNNNDTSAGRSQVMNGQGRMLQREYSDLELGELREPITDETTGLKKKFDRKSSFKESENKLPVSDYRDLDKSRVKPSKITADSLKPSPPNQNIVISRVPDGLYKRKTPENYAGDLSRTHGRALEPQLQQHQSRVDHTEVGSQHNKSSRNRHMDGGANLETGSEAHEDSYKKVPSAPEQQHDLNRVVPPSIKESKKQKSNKNIDSSDRKKDASLTGVDDGGQKRKGPVPDENDYPYSKYDPYSKYEKDEPELKGPIKDSSQYKEYVQEFQEKYASYCSLNKILESYREEFGQYGKHLEAYKGKNTKRYQVTLEKMRTSFHQNGERHKRLKKTFIVLHDELKHLKQMIKDYAASHAKS